MSSIVLSSLANVCILNDWDVSTDVRELGQLRRIGTVEFMAVSHLTAKALSGTVQHLYRHDLEALIWVLVWAISCYADGEKIYAYPSMFDEWDINKPTVCGITKGAFLFSGTHIAPAAESWEAEVRLAHYFLIHLTEICAAASIRVRSRAAMSLTGMDEPAGELDEPEQVWAKLWSNIHQFEKLRYLFPYVPNVLPATIA
ncbi:hypothetical protein FB107DRAFT_207648 [Schizophyllum commune]